MFCFPSFFFVYHVHGPCFVSHLYSLFIMYMGHVLFPIFILCLSCTWAMFCFLFLFFVYHAHGPCFVYHLYSLFIMYIGHVLFPIFFLFFSFSCENKDEKQSMAHVHDKQRIKIGNKTLTMYMINKE
jgi:hypothetical protein